MNFKWNYGKNDIQDCFFVRKKVFVLEQGFDELLEFDDIDDISHHLCIYDDITLPIATARLYEQDGVYHCGRICIVKDYRGKGMGKVIMDELEKKARALNAKSLELSAQVRAVGFYEKSGYIAEGEEYMDEFCPHIKCVKRI